MGKKSRKTIVPTPYNEKELADIAAGRLATITRKQSLCGLIETSISLVVEEKDMSSAHVLIMAAWRVLNDLGKPDRKGPILHDGPRVKGWLFDGYNFFRHASPKYKDATLNMPPILNEILLLDVIVSFVKQYSSAARTPAMTTFLLWFIISKRADVEVLQDILDESLPASVSLETVDKLSRTEFFEVPGGDSKASGETTLRFRKTIRQCRKESVTQ
jgi:hypothetical protein